MTTDEIRERVRNWYARTSLDEREEMWRKQRESWIRAMTTPCEHGVLDFETCAQCRAA